MIKKQPYTAPEAETLEVRTEGIICDSLVFGSSGQAGGDLGLGDDEFNYGSF